MVTARLSKTVAAILLALFAVIQAGAAPFAVVPQPEKPLRIFLRGAPKNHGPAGNGLHDSEVWVREWGALLTARGARVDGGLQFPTPSQLENTDVLVMFAANAGTILGAERASLRIVSETRRRHRLSSRFGRDCPRTALVQDHRRRRVGERRREVLRGREHLTSTSTPSIRSRRAHRTSRSPTKSTGTST